jgi:hypothetical protein
MSIKLLFYIALIVMAGCAITHKRGANAQVAVDYYLENRGTLPAELTKMVTLEKINEADVTIQWTVSEKGETQDITIEHDTLHNESVNTLLIEHLKSMKFPKTPQFTSTTVEYTYKFQKSQKK